MIIYFCGFSAMFFMTAIVWKMDPHEAFLASLLWFIVLPGAAIIKFVGKGEK